MFKKMFALLIAVVVIFSGVCFAATDWSQFETGTSNPRLDGYQGQPGYIAFTNGSGTVLGYIWMNADGQPVFCTKAAIDLTTTKLTDSVGVLLK